MLKEFILLILAGLGFGLVAAFCLVLWLVPIILLFYGAITQNWFVVAAATVLILSMKVSWSRK